MKKFYILAAVTAIAISADAQTLKFTVEGNEITPGQTISYTSKDSEITILPNMVNWFIAPEIKVTGSETGTIDVSASCSSGQEVSLCCGSDCETGASVFKRNVGITADIPFNIEFDYHGYKTGAPDDTSYLYNVVTAISTEYSGQPSTGTAFTLVINPNQQGGTLTIFENGDSLVSEGGALTYSVECESELNLYDADGKNVLSVKVNGNGSLSASSLKNGVYVYTLGSKSGKVIVR